MRCGICGELISESDDNAGHYVSYADGRRVAHVSCFEARVRQNALDKRLGRIKSCDICDRMQPELHFHEWQLDGGNSNFPCDTSYCCICRGCDPDECDILYDMIEQERREVALVSVTLQRDSALWALCVRIDAADKAHGIADRVWMVRPATAKAGGFA